MEHSTLKDLLMKFSPTTHIGENFLMVKISMYRAIPYSHRERIDILVQLV